MESQQVIRTSKWVACLTSHKHVHVGNILYCVGLPPSDSASMYTCAPKSSPSVDATAAHPDPKHCTASARQATH
eukprot:4348985-Amphidinium_carterae.1